MCAHVRKHTMAGIERDVKKGWKTWNVKEDPERKRDRGGGLNRAKPRGDTAGEKRISIDFR